MKLCALLSIPSVSSDPARRKDVMEAATRTAGLMSEVGLEAGSFTHSFVYSLE